MMVLKRLTDERFYKQLTKCLFQGCDGPGRAGLVPVWKPVRFFKPVRFLFRTGPGRTGSCFESGSGFSNRFGSCFQPVRAGPVPVLNRFGFLKAVRFSFRCIYVRIYVYTRVYMYIRAYIRICAGIYI